MGRDRVGVLDIEHWLFCADEFSSLGYSECELSLVAVNDIVRCRSDNLNGSWLLGYDFPFCLSKSAFFLNNIDIESYSEVLVAVEEVEHVSVSGTYVSLSSTI